MVAGCRNDRFYVKKKRAALEYHTSSAAAEEFFGFLARRGCFLLLSSLLDLGEVAASPNKLTAAFTD